MKWKRISSEDKEYTKLLIDENHIKNYKDRIYEICEVEKKQTKETTTRGIEHTITALSDENMLKDKEGRYLDIVIYKEDGNYIWEPFVERVLREELFKLNITDYNFYYLDSKIGYIFVQEFKFIS